MYVFEFVSREKERACMIELYQRERENERTREEKTRQVHVQQRHKEKQDAPHRHTRRRGTSVGMVVVRASIAFPMWGESWHRHCLSELPKTAPIEGRWYYKERGLLWAAEKERVNIVCHHHHHQDDAWRRGWQHPKEDASVW